MTVVSSFRRYTSQPFSCAASDGRTSHTTFGAVGDALKTSRRDAAWSD
jgi:hypothetical protein